jgi:hypothetical protein
MLATRTSEVWEAEVKEAMTEYYTQQKEEWRRKRWKPKKRSSLRQRERMTRMSCEVD